MLCAQTDAKIAAAATSLIGRWKSQVRNEEDYEEVRIIASQSKDQLITTFAIPFVFMLILSFSISKVWNLYLML